EEDSLNGSLKWAYGAIGSRLNPIRQLMVSDVYFNKQSLFNSVALSIGGFGFQFYEATLRAGGISFGGELSFKIIEREIKNVVFNDKGFVGVDAALRFKLDSDIRMFKEDSDSEASGEISVTHYEQKVEGINNYYGLKFDADLDKIAKVGVELAFKKVDD